MRHLSSILAVLVFSTTMFVANSFAVPITFTHTGSGSGSIGGSAFGISAFTITSIGDTDNRQSLSGSAGFFIEHDSASIAIDGVGMFNFVTGTRTFFNDNSDIVGFSRISGADLFNGPVAATLDGWDMLTSIGPVSGTGTLLQWANSPVITDGGQLFFSNGSPAGTFAAAVSVPVPEPSTMILLGSGLIGLVGFNYKRNKKTI